MTYGQSTPPPPGRYPVDLFVTPERAINQLWGIPFIGHMARAFLAIPHAFVLWLLGIGLSLWIWLGWIAILVNGRVPGIAVELVREYMLRTQKVAGYAAFLLPGGYPPLEPGLRGPVELEMRIDSLEINRLWGIPLVGIFVRVIMLIPQFFVALLLSIVVFLSLLVLWIPILLTGRYPDWAASLYGTFMRYTSRVTAWAAFMPVPYPPIGLD
jgi:hypothetical protein